jgi:hypothetical protein
MVPLWSAIEEEPLVLPGPPIAVEPAFGGGPTREESLVEEEPFPEHVAERRKRGRRQRAESRDSAGKAADESADHIGEPTGRRLLDRCIQARAAAEESEAPSFDVRAAVQVPRRKDTIAPHLGHYVAPVHTFASHQREKPAVAGYP